MTPIVPQSVTRFQPVGPTGARQLRVGVAGPCGMGIPSRNSGQALPVGLRGIGILPMKQGLEGAPQRGILRWGPQAHATWAKSPHAIALPAGVCDCPRMRIVGRHHSEGAFIALWIPTGNRPVGVTGGGPATTTCLAPGASHPQGLPALRLPPVNGLLVRDALKSCGRELAPKRHRRGVRSAHLAGNRVEEFFSVLGESYSPKARPTPAFQLL
jgi:hypothetical protein